MRNLHQHKFLRCALAVTLACGLSVPTTAISAYADGENTSTPPLAGGGTCVGGAGEAPGGAGAGPAAAGGGAPRFCDNV